MMRSSEATLVSERDAGIHSKVRRAVLWIGIVAGTAGACLYHTASGIRPAEKAARDYVLLEGYTNEGYTHTLVSEIASLAYRSTDSRPIGTRSLTGVGFPMDRMTDTMVEHLVKIRNLDQIVLYPRHPSGKGVDFNATELTGVSSLEELGQRLSPESLSMLKRKRPQVRVAIARRPVSSSSSKKK